MNPYPPLPDGIMQKLNDDEIFEKIEFPETLEAVLLEENCSTSENVCDVNVQSILEEFLDDVSKEDEVIYDDSDDMFGDDVDDCDDSSIEIDIEEEIESDLQSDDYDKESEETGIESDEEKEEEEDDSNVLNEVLQIQMDYIDFPKSFVKFMSSTEDQDVGNEAASLVKFLLRHEDFCDLLYLCVLPTGKKSEERLFLLEWLDIVLSPDNDVLQKLSNWSWSYVNYLRQCTPGTYLLHVHAYVFPEDIMRDVFMEKLWLPEILRQILHMKYKYYLIEKAFGGSNIVGTEDISEERKQSEMISFVGWVIKKELDTKFKNYKTEERDIVKKLRRLKSEVSAEEYSAETTILFQIRNMGGLVIPHILLNDWGMLLLDTIRRSYDMKHHGNSALILLRSNIERNHDISSSFYSAWSHICGNDHNNLRDSLLRTMTKSIINARVQVYHRILHHKFFSRSANRKSGGHNSTSTIRAICKPLRVTHKRQKTTPLMTGTTAPLIEFEMTPEFINAIKNKQIAIEECIRRRFIVRKIEVTKWTLNELKSFLLERCLPLETDVIEGATSESNKDLNYILPKAASVADVNIDESVGDTIVTPPLPIASDDEDIRDMPDPLANYDAKKKRFRKRN
jgi:hypothetical protein